MVRTARTRLLGRPGNLRCHHSVRIRPARAIVSVLAVSLAAFVSATSAAAAPVLDQEQPVLDLSVGGLAIASWTQELAQVITPGVDGLLTTVSFPLVCNGPDLTVDIRRLDNGLPTGALLATQLVPGALLPDG